MRLVFVHGAMVTDGRWWWHKMTPLLAASGIASRAVDLPSCDAEPRGDLHEDADAVRAALDEEDGPAILCGHSYGGMVITEAAAGRTDIARLLYVTSFLARTDESLGSFGGTEPAPYLLPCPDDTVTVQEEYLRPRFAHDVDDETFEGARQRVTNQAQRVFGQAPLGAAWQTLPSTYVVCADDRGTPPEVQRGQANRATDMVELATGHHPFLSHPELLARTIAGLVL